MARQSKRSHTLLLRANSVSFAKSLTPMSTLVSFPSVVVPPLPINSRLEPSGFGYFHDIAPKTDLGQQRSSQQAETERASKQWRAHDHRHQPIEC
jgi:hypothetical protein